MADSRPSSFLSEDVSSWLQSIVDYAKDTQAKRLDFRTLPVDSFLSVGANIQPILNALVDSTISELHLRSIDLTDKLQEYSEILVKTKIEKLNICPCDVEAEDILSLVAILKDTRITELDISESDRMLVYDQVDEFYAHLENSRLRSLKMSLLYALPFCKIALLPRTLSSTQITRLDLCHVFSRKKCFYSKEDHTRLIFDLLSKLTDTPLIDLNLGWNDINDASSSAIFLLLGKSKLERLNLTENAIGDTGVRFLIPALLCSKLTHLNLSRNLIKGNNHLGHSLKETKIRELDLSTNPLDDRMMLSGYNFLRGSSVVVLKLGNRLSPCERVTLSPAQILNFKFSELTCLDISSNDLGLEHITALACVLCHSKITHLNLFENALSKECYNILGDCLKTSVLKYIDLSKTAHSHESFHGIASFLEKTKGSEMISVDLLFNKLRSDLAIIASSLANTPIFQLDLSHTECKKNIASLTPHLKLTAITALYLNNNYITDDDAEVLANCLEETEVVFLNMKNNKVTDLGAKALAIVLEKTKLRHLNLRANNIGDDGLESLAEHAESSCLTYLNVSWNPGKRKLLVDRVLWKNRRKLQQFADLLKETALFTGDSNIFEFDRDFDGIDIDIFIEKCLKIHKIVLEEPSIISAIEQDKRILDLQKTKCCKFNSEYTTNNEEFVDDIFFGDCEHLYETILKQPSSVHYATGNNGDVSFFKKQALWLILEYFPTKFVSFVGGSIEADMDQHVSFLRKIEELGLTRIVELLLLNRPIYVIDKKQNILHPYVYILLRKYKQTICNLEIEPEGVKRIIEYFTKHIDLEYASEVISLLDNSTMPHVLD